MRLRARSREALDGFTVVITKSTVPVGTGDEVERIIRETRPRCRFRGGVQPGIPARRRGDPAISSIPTGSSSAATDARAREVMAELYRPLYLNRSPILFTDRRTAELIKYAANAFLATKITFINEIADLAEKVGADVQEVARGIGLDNRIGSKFLHAGPGYGGSCFPKDTVALIKTAQDHAAPLRIVEAVAAVNDARKRAMARKVAAALGGELRGKTVARARPDVQAEHRRHARGAVDPADHRAAGHGRQGARLRSGRHGAGQEPSSATSHSARTPIHAPKAPSALVIVTEWEQFRALDFERLKSVMAQPVLVDLRNVYRPEEIARHGFIYESVGRPRK